MHKVNQSLDSLNALLTLYKDDPKNVPLRRVLAKIIEQRKSEIQSENARVLQEATNALHAAFG